MCTALSGRLEIKHGRTVMPGFLLVFARVCRRRRAGLYLSTSQGLKVSNVPVGCFASLEAVPTTGWLEITVLTGLPETGLASKAQTDNAEGGGRRHRPRLEMPSLVQTAQTIAASDSLVLAPCSYRACSAAHPSEQCARVRVSRALCELYAVNVNYTICCVNFNML